MDFGVAIWAVLLAALVLGLIAAGRQKTVVYGWETGLLYENGVFKRVLGAGKHNTWALGRTIEIFRVPNHHQFSAVGPLDVVSADRFAFRMSAQFVYRVIDHQKAFEDKLDARLQVAAKDALANLASTHPLDELLAKRSELGEALKAAIAPHLPDANIETALVAGLTLPPEIRRLVVEVERAKLEGQAALERARGEHAALRALANAARLAKDNPELMNLRMLQALGKGSTLVLGQPAFTTGATKTS